MLTAFIPTLLNLIRTALTSLIEFLLALFLSGAAALLYALPWILRLASILLWLTAAFIGLQTIRTIYAPSTDAIPLFALQFAVILLMSAWAMSAVKDGKQIWGVLAAGGGAGWAISVLAIQLSEHWKYAEVFFDVLPPTLFAFGMIHLATRTRARRFLHE